MTADSTGDQILPLAVGQSAGCASHVDESTQEDEESAVLVVVSFLHNNRLRGENSRRKGNRCLAVKAEEKGNDVPSSSENEATADRLTVIHVGRGVIRVAISLNLCF